MTDIRDLEGTLKIPQDVADGAYAYVERQEAAGLGELRHASTQGSPPWPTADNAMLRMLLQKATLYIDAGGDPKQVVLDLAVHAWFEGHIEGYAAGQDV